MGMNMVQLDNNNFIVQSHVGQVIMSTTLDTEDKVKQYYGGTSWTKIEGRFLIGASSSYGVGTTGGEATHILTQAELPKTTGTIRAYNDFNLNNSDLKNIIKGVFSYDESTSFGTSSNLTSGTSDAVRNFNFNLGNSQAHNNIPPYYAVYIWVRTA